MYLPQFSQTTTHYGMIKKYVTLLPDCVGSVRDSPSRVTRLKSKIFQK